MSCLNRVICFAILRQFVEHVMLLVFVCCTTGSSTVCMLQALFGSAVWYLIVFGLPVWLRFLFGMDRVHCV